MPTSGCNLKSRLAEALVSSIKGGTMLVRLLDGCKLLAWGMVAGSCLVAAIISHRAPNSIWPGARDSPNLHTALTREVALLQTTAWNGHTPTSEFCVNPSRPGTCQSLDQASPPRPEPLHQTATCDVQPGCRGKTCDETAPATNLDSDFVIGDHADEHSSDFVAQPPPCNDDVRPAHVQQAPVEHAPIAQVLAEQSYGAHKLETRSVTEITNRKVTMRDATTNIAVATLTIAGPIESSTLPPETIELAKAERRQNKALRSAHQLSTAKQHFINAYRDEKTGHFTIEAQTIEIAELVDYFAERFGLPIVCHESAIGTVSASVSEVTLVRAIRRLVEPFGFALVEYGPQIVIGELEALEYAARIEAAAHEAQMLAAQETAEYEAAAQAAAQLAAADVVELTATKRLAPRRSAESAQRLPPVGRVSHVSHDAPAIVARLTATPEETAIGTQAKAMVADGQLAETVDLLTDAVGDYPNSAILYRMLAEVYFHRDDLRAAETAAKRSLAIDKSNPLTNRIYGEILRQMGQRNRSQHYLQQAKFLGQRSM